VGHLVTSSISDEDEDEVLTPTVKAPCRGSVRRAQFVAGLGGGVHGDVALGAVPADLDASLGLDRFRRSATKPNPVLGLLVRSGLERYRDRFELHKCRSEVFDNLSGDDLGSGKVLGILE
jgi:hypothetical protein